MDFSLSAEQRELKEAAVAFARRELDQDLAEREEAGEFSPEAWRACAKFGVQGLPVPAELGGGGADILTTVLVMEALGYGCHDNGLIFSLNAQMWSLELPLVKFGTPAQQQAYLPGLMSGDLIGVHAMTEPDSGSDAFSMRTRAERQGDQLRAQRDQAVHHQRPGRRRGAGLRLAPRQAQAGGDLRVPRGQGDARVHREPRAGEDGPADLADGRGRADDCVVPAENRLGPEGAGMAIFNSSMAWERSCILASALGAMQRQLEACVSTGGRASSSVSPSGSSRRWRARWRTCTCGLRRPGCWCTRPHGLASRASPALAEAAAAKLFASEAWVASSLDAIQIHGAYGYMKESGIERDLRDAVASTIYSGTSEIQRVILARMLGL